MAIIKGKVQKISSRDTQYGAMYSIQVNGEYYSVGKYPPKCAEGDYVKFDVTQNGKYWNLTKGSKVEKVSAEDVPASSSSPSAASSGYSRPAYGGDDKRQEVISKQAARNSALEFTQLALSCGAIEFPKTASADKKFAILTAFVDETTEKYYNYSVGKVAKAEGTDAGDDGEDNPADSENWD